MRRARAPYSSASTASAIISPAFGPLNNNKNSTSIPVSLFQSTKHAPMICTPSITSVSASTRNLTWPSASKFVFARELAKNGKLPTLYFTPACLSSCSVFPTKRPPGACILRSGSCRSSRGHACYVCTLRRRYSPPPCARAYGRRSRRRCI